MSFLSGTGNDEIEVSLVSGFVSAVLSRDLLVDDSVDVFDEALGSVLEAMRGHAESSQPDVEEMLERVEGLNPVIEDIVGLSGQPKMRDILGRGEKLERSLAAHVTSDLRKAARPRCPIVISV